MSFACFALLSSQSSQEPAPDAETQKDDGASASSSGDDGNSDDDGDDSEDAIPRQSAAQAPPTPLFLSLSRLLALVVSELGF